MIQSALYPSTIWHKRFTIKQHAFRYKVLSILFDLDELEKLSKISWLFSYNRNNLFSFHDRDHGARNGSSLKSWAEQNLRPYGIDVKDGSIRILCMPRLLGLVFNPLSVWFCYDSSKLLKAVIYEVRNTFGENHAYIIPIGQPDALTYKHRCTKSFFVSPFFKCEGIYNFKLELPGKTFSLAIQYSDDEGKKLFARQFGKQHRWSDRALLKGFIQTSFVPGKVLLAIYWEAFRLWLKKIPITKHRPHKEPFFSAGHSIPLLSFFQHLREKL